MKRKKQEKELTQKQIDYRNNKRINDNIRQLMVKRGTVWTDDEARLFSLSCKTHEGPGEKSIRARLGLSLANISHEKIDIPEYDTECKFLATASSLIKLNASGMDAKVIAACDVSAQINKKLNARELFKHDVELLLKEKLGTYLGMMRLSVSFTQSFMCILMKQGFFSVPKIEVDDAFEWIKISQHSPRYKLKPSYVEEQLVNDRVIDPLLTYVQELQQSRHHDMVSACKNNPNVYLLGQEISA